MLCPELVEGLSPNTIEAALTVLTILFVLWGLAICGRIGRRW